MGHRAEDNSKGIGSPFPAMDSGSAALRRPCKTGNVPSRGPGTERDAIELDEPAAKTPRDAAGRTTRAIKDFEADTPAAPRDRPEYAIDAGSARAMNLARRYAVQRPLVLSWKKDETLVGRTARARAERRMESRPAAPRKARPTLAPPPPPPSPPVPPAPDDDIIELTEIV